MKKYKLDLYYSSMDFLGTATISATNLQEAITQAEQIIDSMPTLFDDKKIPSIYKSDRL